MTFKLLQIELPSMIMYTTQLLALSIIDIFHKNFLCAKDLLHVDVYDNLSAIDKILRPL